LNTPSAKANKAATPPLPITLHQDLAPLPYSANPKAFLKLYLYFVNTLETRKNINNTINQFKPPKNTTIKPIMNADIMPVESRNLNLKEIIERKIKRQIPIIKSIKVNYI
ncbi:MAG: hypothetical protein N3A63_10305, partial [Bacteroidetes bacterium]|nr:hypothetical protein [Bacteroidota bacterium]